MKQRRNVQKHPEIKSKMEVNAPSKTLIETVHLIGQAGRISLPTLSSFLESRKGTLLDVLRSLLLLDAIEIEG